ncbi:MAG: rhodanese-like domain-containing protein [Bacteroidetes bacterium]|nr:rhodanese-like domain-containing protein [Bacteroidota bacterium]
MPNFIVKNKDCIEIDELIIDLKKNNKIQIIDVRSREEFNAGHIPLSLHIELKELKNQLVTLDLSVQYITTCGKGGGRSADGAKILQSHGFISNWLCGGVEKWLEKRNLLVHSS